MRPYSKRFNPPFVMIGEQVSRVIKSRNGEYPVGTIVLSKAGWRSHYISPNGIGLEPISFDLGSTPLSHCLGTLGMPGATAFFGFVKMLEPKKGQTLIVIIKFCSLNKRLEKNK